MAERLSNITDSWNLTLAQFADKLAERHAADPHLPQEPGAFEAFWGGDPHQSAAACRHAVYQLVVPADPCTRQISHAVGAAAELGLVLVDDEIGTCFLPDGTLLPEDAREMWEFELAEMDAPPRDPALGDGRTWLERLGGELFDALGRGNKRS